MVSGLFSQSRDKSMQAEMAFLEANKKLSSVLKSRPMGGTEMTSHPQTESGEKKHQEDKTTKTTVGKSNETGDHHVFICSVPKALFHSFHS